MSKRLQIIKAPCDTCLSLTKHDVLFEFDNSGSNEDIMWWEYFQIIRCRGCGSIGFRKTFSSTEDLDNYGNPIEKIEIYPPRIAGRKPIRDYQYISKKVRTIYLEVYRALSIGAVILAGIGIRAIVEGVCIDCSATGKTLEEKIESLAQKGYLSKEQVDSLHATRLMGNIVVHEIIPPKMETLGAALDIIDNLLQTCLLYTSPSPRDYA